MRTIIASVLAFFALFSFACSGQNQHDKSKLSATAFSEKIKENKNAVILDVRTAEEFSKGHLQNALNYDWNGSNFEQQIAKLDKNDPQLVYCLMGSRSAAAANKMREKGFKEVYELSGGILKWRASGLPESFGDSKMNAGLNRIQFNELLNSDKLVLIDFYADWCAPCKKMKPYLEEISHEMADKVKVVRINSDDNQALFKALEVDELPVLQLYKNQNLIWSNTGFIEKAAVVEHLKK
jgi:thioredoxin 1